MSGGYLVVAPWGDDTACGNERNPVRTLTEAQRRIRALGDAAPELVYLRGADRGGVWRLDQTLVLGPPDAGSDPHPITWATFPGDAHAVLSGGVRVTGWTAAGGGSGIWQAPLPSTVNADIREVYVNGTALFRARHRVQCSWNGTRNNTPRGVLVDDPILPTLAHPERLWLIWEAFGFLQNQFPITALFGLTGGAFELVMPSAAWPSRYATLFAQETAPQWLENAYEFLGVGAEGTGAFVVDPSARIIYVSPQYGMDLGAPGTEVIVPRLARILDVQALSRDITLSGISFQHGYWAPDPAFGYNGSNFADMLGPYSTTIPLPYTVSPYPLPTVPVPGNIEVAGQTDHITFTDCEFTRCGGVCLRARDDAGWLTVSASEIHHTSGQGVQVGCFADNFLSQRLSSPAHDVVYTDNDVHDCGLLYPHAGGLCAQATSGVTHERNTIHDMPYSGSFFGVLAGTPGTPNRGYVSRHNHYYRTMSHPGFWDGGSWYAAGSCPQSQVYENVFATTGENIGQIYLDVGSVHWDIRRNILPGNGDMYWINPAADTAMANNFTWRPTGHIARLPVNTLGSRESALPYAADNQSYQVGPYPATILARVAGIEALAVGAGGPSAPRMPAFTQLPTAANRGVLTWAAPLDSGVGPISGYEIWVNGEVFGTVFGDVTSYTFIALEPNERYTFQVAALDSAVLYSFPWAVSPAPSQLTVPHRGQLSVGVTFATGPETPPRGLRGEVVVVSFRPYYTG